MKSDQVNKSINEIVSLKNANMLKVNAEYQRGAVWSLSQNRKLIDSVMRGYPLPVIYLHYIEREIAGMKSSDLDIIDGQQRINALVAYAEGAFKAFHPIADEAEARFPAFIKSLPCPWGGKDIHELDEQTRSQFLETQLSIALINTEEKNEVRDLFVRLQSGLPLNYQETRDAWPGNFTDFILWLGGKPEINRYPGHDFFKEVMKMKPSTDRGATRTLAAQLAMLFLGRQEKGKDYYCDINAVSISKFYYDELDFDRNSSNAKRLIEILNKLKQLLGTGYFPKLRAHDAIHLLLLVDHLWDDYTRDWEANLGPALDKFLSKLSEAKAAADSEMPHEYWTNYLQWTRTSSDRGEVISRRHRFYITKMFDFLAPLNLKDKTRLFGEMERAVLYYRQNKLCAVCDGLVAWQDIEVHHVKRHFQGGQTTLENGAVVHKHCHPKSQAGEVDLIKKLDNKMKTDAEHKKDIEVILMELGIDTKRDPSDISN